MNNGEAAATTANVPLPPPLYRAGADSIAPTFQPLFSAEQMQAMYEAGRASSAPAQGMVLVPRELVAFLDGESPIDGVWFGERHPDHKGLFWWRKALMLCVASPGAASVAGKEGVL